VVVALVVLTACGGTPSNPVSPAPTNTNPMDTPPASFSFLRVPDSGSAWELPVWGLRGDNSQELVRHMVFCDAEGGALYASPNIGYRPLSRLVGPSTIVVRDGDFTSEQIAGIESSARYMESIIGFPMAVDTGLAVGARIGLIVDPSITTNGLVAINAGRGGGPITEVDIRIRQANMTLGLDSTLTHELGHAIGLCHHNRPGLMGAFRLAGQGLLPAEFDNAVIMYKVPVSTPFPGLGASATFSPSAGHPIRHVIRD
jgi:hypothetical protein